MREYILTDREREILQTYLENNIKLDGFSVLALRLKRANKKLLEDVKLIEAFLKKLESET
ncbi:MAG: hypothetical protein ACPLKZ_02105 [Candidatus Bathyarchaeales archaeon]